MTAPVLVASGRKLDLRKARDRERLGFRWEQWMSQALQYIELIPELGQLHNYAGNMVKRVTWYVGARPELDQAPAPLTADLAKDLAIPVALADAANEELARIDAGADGGLPALQYLLGWHMSAVGKAYLLGIPPESGDAQGEEVWDVASFKELTISGEQVRRADRQGGTPVDLPPDTAVGDIWKRHPVWSGLPTSPMMHLLNEAEELLILGRMFRALSMSRIPAGLMKLPSDLALLVRDTRTDTDEGDGPTPGEVKASNTIAFLDKLFQMLTDPITNEESGGGVVPGAIVGPADALNALGTIDFTRPFDQQFLEREDKALARIARGVDMPRAVVLDELVDATHWNAAQIDDDTFTAHVEPLVVLCSSGVWSSYLKPALRARGFAREDIAKIGLWHDKSQLVGNPNQAQDADSGYDKILVSGESWRRYHNFTEEDAPDDAEYQRRLDEIVVRRSGARFTATTPGQLEQIEQQPTDQTAPTRNPNPPSTPPTTNPAQPLPATGPNAPQPMAAAGVRLAGLGRALTRTDRALRARILGEANQSMRRAIEKVGARLRRNAATSRTAAAQRLSTENPDALHVAAVVGRAGAAELGIRDTEALIDASAFGELRRTFDRHVAAAQADVRRLARRQGEIDPEVETAQDHYREAAGGVLVAGLVALAHELLFQPDRPVPPAGEFDETSLVPEGLVRQTLAVAGGDETAHLNDRGAVVSDAVTNTPVGGVATGTTAMDLFEQAGLHRSDYTWSWGGSTRPFDPHLDLDGTPFDEWDDPVLATPGEADWLGVDFLFPGDHDGCFPAGTIVSGPTPRGATLRDWKGELSVVRFASGKLLTATPNHPVLTDRGWVPAGLLNEGDHVLRCVDADRVSALVPDEAQMPARIENVAGALLESEAMVTRRVPVAAEHFHGDGLGSEVAVVATHRNLRDGFDPELGEPSCESSLGGTGRRAGALTAERHAGALLDRVAASRRLVRGFGPGSGPGGSTLSGGKPRGFGGTTEPHAGLGEPSDDRHPVDGEEGGELVRGTSGFVQGDELADVDWTPAGRAAERADLGSATDRSAALTQPSHDGETSDPEEIGELVRSAAGLVELDKVLDVERLPFAGHVYNLDTGGWYLADGVIVHNCSCDFDVAFVVQPAEGSADEEAAA